MNAPAATSCTASRTLALGARVKGDWTRALNRYAKEEQSRIAGALGEKKEDVAEIPVQVMLDGPYGGCSIDLGRYESVLLLAGGAGATFTLSLLDDIVGRCVKLGRRNGERTRRIEFAWAIRSFGTSPSSRGSPARHSQRLGCAQDASSGSRLCSWKSRAPRLARPSTCTSPSS